MLNNTNHFQHFVEILSYTNHNVQDIITPVKSDVLHQLLTTVNYNKQKTEYLVDGFKNGFSLCYQGPLKTVKRTAPNLKLRVGSPVELWNKVMKKVELGRYAGLFKEPPFDNFVQSPIGLVPKDKGKKTRLILHLSYPRTGDSVNSGIPKNFCSVKYPDFEEAIKICVREGVGCHIAKSDMSSAFRHVPMRPDQWYLLVMKATHPITKETFYFVDKCLPFGSSISCAIFQAISDAIAFVVEYKTKKNNVNYLDDHLFAAAMRMACNRQVRTFLKVCELIRFPVALEKTYWGTTLLSFLGLLLDTVNQVVCIPLDKLEKARNMIDKFLAKKKATVLEFQKLAGSLNFLCRCIVPGRAFLRRLYLPHVKGLKPHHHVKVTRENKLDLLTWKNFLAHPSVFARDFIQTDITSAQVLDMYSDASRNFKLGFGAYCGSEWTWGQWNEEFCNKVQPSIEYLELFGVTVGVLNWLRLFKNKKILLFCDNEAVVHMINNTSSKCRNCMILIRMIVLEGLICNTRVFAKYVKSKDNNKADALSRMQWSRFNALKVRDGMNEKPTAIPSNMWPMDKLWLY